jgi:hypothetical protein
MNNVFKDFKVGVRFDLKGSVAGRTQLKKGEKPYDKGRDQKVALKDNDFREHFEKLEFLDTHEEMSEQYSKALDNESRRMSIYP